MNMQALMQQAKQMQKDITNAQKIINETEFTGKNGLVTVTMMGDKRLKEVKIEQDDDIKEDLSILEDMIVLATNDALNQVDKLTEEKMGKYSNMMPGLF